MDHVVYNLTSDQEAFTCAGYAFRRVANYGKAVTRLYRCGTVTRPISVRPNRTSFGRWQGAQEERPGVMTPTYTARWIDGTPEPNAFIYPGETKLISDVLLLWSLWGGEFACTGAYAVFETATFTADNLFRTKEELRAAVDRVVSTLNEEIVGRVGLDPAVFLLMESFRTRVAHYETLFLSPALDALVSKETSPTIAQADTDRLKEVKRELTTVLESKRPSDPDADALWRNVLNPFFGTINGIGQPAAVNKLVAFLQKSPALQPLRLNPAVLETHARAFNKFRNATIHNIGLPEKVPLRFDSGRRLEVRRTANRDVMLRALIYYTQAFRQMMVLHFSRLLSVQSPWGEARVQEMLRGFFVDGLWNGHDWVAGAFMDEVDPVRRGD